MNYQSRMGAMLRRQEGVRRSRDRYLIIGMILFMIAAGLGYVQTREETAFGEQLWQRLLALPLILYLVWGSWRCASAAMTLSRLYTDPKRLAAMESLEELPGFRETLLPFLPAND